MCLSLEFIDFTKTSVGIGQVGKLPVWKSSPASGFPTQPELGIPGSSGACSVKCSSTSFQTAQVLQCLCDLKNKRKQILKKQPKPCKDLLSSSELWKEEISEDFATVWTLKKKLNGAIPTHPKKASKGIFLFLLSTSCAFYPDNWCWQY